MMSSSPSFNQRCTSSLLKNAIDNEDAKLQEDDTCFLLSMEMPHVNGKDIQISLRDNTLMVGGFRSSDRRKRQRISHSFEIDPEAVDLDRAIAKVFNGCLTLYAPKRSSSSSSSTFSVVDSDDDDELDCSL